MQDMSEPTQRRRYQFGPFCLDPAEQLLLRHGDTVVLTPKVFETLWLLVQNCGRVIEKEKFIAKLWPDTCVEPNNLNVNISALRKALGTTQDGQEYIETVPRKGYRFTAAVCELPGDEPATSGVVEEGSPREAAINSLAVLPFVNASDDPNAEYLSDGITESIINNLSQLPQLRVIARSTAFRYQGRDIHPQEAGREMGVRAVLTGRVFQYSARLIIRTELTDVNDGWQLWGEQYNSEPSDIFVVQEEISREISEKLLLRLSGAQKKRITKRHTDSASAYQSYLKGRYHWNKRTVEGLAKGIEFFEKAISEDRAFALAHCGLADSYLLLGSLEYGALNPVEAVQKARDAATAALSLDDTLAEAHASLAYVRIFDWDWAEAEREYLRAIELNPSYATAHHWYALFLTAMGRAEKGWDNLMRAREIDPLSLPISVGVGLYYYLTRRYDEAIEEYRKTLEMEPSFYMARFGLGMAYEQKGRFADAIDEYDKAYALSGGSPLMRAALGHAYAVTGRRAEAREVLAELSQMGGGSGRSGVSPYFTSAIYAALGEKDEAFRCLHEACEMRSEGVFWIKVDPMLDSLRTDPRFRDVLARVRLAP